MTDGPVSLWTSASGYTMIALDHVSHVSGGDEVRTQEHVVRILDVHLHGHVIGSITVRGDDCQTFLAQWRDFHELVVSNVGRLPKESR